MADYDFFIVGQGLAGSLLAWHLMQAKQKVLVMDDAHHTAASRIAAGMVNPLAGMRFNCHPDTGNWLQTALALYRSLEPVFGKVYWHPVGMQRLFRSAEQQRFYQRQLDNQSCAHYLGASLLPSDQIKTIRYPHGGFWQQQTGYVDLPNLLQDMQNWLQQHQALLATSIDYAQIQPGPGQVSYQGKSARHLLFCEGYRMRCNPWFQHLPLQADKGEILTLRTDQPISQSIVNGAHWLIPLANGDYRFGATHAHHTIDRHPTQAGKTTLQQGLAQLLTSTRALHITQHLAGVRPGTQDRQPLIGTHPQYTRLHVFNGFGARGALTIPWFAHCLTDCLLHGHALPAAVDIQRYR